MKAQHQKAAVLAATALLSIAILTWYLQKIKRDETSGGGSSDASSSKRKPRSGPPSQPDSARDGGTVGTTASSVATDERGIHAEIEELDKKGKAFFKEKEVSMFDDALRKAGISISHAVLFSDATHTTPSS
jgi:hypothetical protein